MKMRVGTHKLAPQVAPSGCTFLLRGMLLSKDKYTLRCPVWADQELKEVIHDQECNGC